MGKYGAFSRPVHSTALPSLLKANNISYFNF